MFNHAARFKAVSMGFIKDYYTKSLSYCGLTIIKCLEKLYKMSGKNIKVQGNTQNVTKQCLENVKCLEKMANTWRGGYVWKKAKI